MEGRCTKCGTLYPIGTFEESFGSQVCPYCGAALEIKGASCHSFTVSSPFTAKVYRDDPINASPTAIHAVPSNAIGLNDQYPAKESAVDPIKAAPAAVHAEPSNAISINDQYIMNREIENPYISGLQKAIEDFKRNT